MSEISEAAWVYGKLINPIQVFASLKRQGETYLLLLMLSPFLEAAIYEHLSIVLAAIGVVAFFRIVHLVASEPAEESDSA